ncbi:MAG: ribonuclease HI [Clostridia bacterium]|nr:ribonuclease HI [Clostridia bacterium]
MKKVEIFTDGACKGNPGPGGWGTILRFNGHEKELSGGEAMTTNNRMEMMAVIEGLKALKEPCKVTLTSDSQYVCNGINKGWAAKWQKNNWIKSDKTKAKNPELWEELLGLLKIHNVEIIWVRGHNGHAENERCDRLAVAAAEKYK